MDTLILKTLIDDTSSNSEGLVLFSRLKNAHLNNSPIVLVVDSDLHMSSSFLNTSFGYFLEEYGISNFKKTVSFKGSKMQFDRLSKYINSYLELSCA